MRGKPQNDGHLPNTPQDSRESEHPRKENAPLKRGKGIDGRRTKYKYVKVRMDEER